MPLFTTPVDIANRALQHCGVALIDTTYGFNEDSDRAAQTSFVYDKLRRAELRRNTWRYAIKNTVLRPIQNDASVYPTMRLDPTLWDSGTTYFIGSVVRDAQNALWVSNANDNLNQAPGNSAYWDAYYGPLAIPPWDTTGGTSYNAGEVVYTTAGAGTYVVYLSRVNNNEDTPSTVPAFSSTGKYMKGSLVVSSAVNYQSLVDFNTGNTPSSSNAPNAWVSTTTYAAGDKVRGTDGLVYTSINNGNVAHDPVADITHVFWTQGGIALWTSQLTRTASSDKWLVLTAALSQMDFTFPLGMGPSTRVGLRSAYYLPANYLRRAHQEPKSGSYAVLGGPSNPGYLDWDFQGRWLLTRDVGPIMFRFVADVSNVTEMDELFCEGLAARIAFEVCPKLTQSSQKLSDIAAAYQKFMNEARIVNGIETGPEEPPEDDFLACRV